MGDNWDDSDDEWDIASEDEDELDKRLGLTKSSEVKDEFEDEDLTIKEKAEQEKFQQQSLKVKGKALAAKKQAEQDRKDEEELVRRAMELESEMEANMSIDERRALEKKRVEDADHSLTDDLFGGVDEKMSANVGAGTGGTINAGDVVKMKDLKDHLKHARKVAQCMKVCVFSHNMAKFVKFAFYCSFIC